MDRSKRIKEMTDEVCSLLIEKNDAYGDSALSPLNVFSKGTSVDSLCARIDDKLSRIKNRGLNDNTEDTLTDLIGYLVLLRIALEESENNYWITTSTYKNK